MIIYFFMMGFHLIIIIQSLLSGMPKQHITYSKNHYNFNMHSHRLIVSFHYVMVVFFIIYLNAFEYGIFPFSLILFNLINGMTIIILSRVILVFMIVAFTFSNIQFLFLCPATHFQTYHFLRSATPEKPPS